VKEASTLTTKPSQNYQTHGFLFPHSETVLVYKQVMTGSNYFEIMHLSNASQVSSLFGWFIGLFNSDSLSGYVDQIKFIH
jgi:hypothetical protein